MIQWRVGRSFSKNKRAFKCVFGGCFKALGFGIPPFFVNAIFFVDIFVEMCYSNIVHKFNKSEERMKTKVIKKSYDEVMALPRPAARRPKIIIRLNSRFIVRLPKPLWCSLWEIGLRYVPQRQENIKLSLSIFGRLCYSNP